MPARIAEHVPPSTARPVPGDPAARSRAHPRQPRRSPSPHAVGQAAALSGPGVDRVHMVGGGSQNELLCQLTADALGLPVLAGPVEATALGNVLVQARALRRCPGASRPCAPWSPAPTPTRPALRAGRRPAS